MSHLLSKSKYIRGLQCDRALWLDVFNPRLARYTAEQMRRFRLEPKRLRLVHKTAAHPARLALIEALLDARPGLTIQPPLLTHTPDGRETDEIRRIYSIIN